VQVANYCRERLQVLLSQELSRLGKDLGEVGVVDMKEHWDELFSKCFQRVDDEVSGRVSRLGGAYAPPCVMGGSATGCKYQDLEGSLGTKGVDQIAILAKRDEPATNSR